MSTRDEFDDRDFTTGRFKSGNELSVRHGAHTNNLPSEYAHLRADLDDFVAGCLVDEGDANDIPTRRKAQLKYRAMLHQHIETLHAALIVKGYFDAKGRLRATWLQRIEGLINTAKGIDKELGLERRQKRVPSVTELMAQIQQDVRASDDPAQRRQNIDALDASGQDRQNIDGRVNGSRDISSASAPPIAGEDGE